MSTAEPLPDARSPLPESPFTVADLFDLPEDGNRYELLDGSLLVSPAPRFLHQLVATRLLLDLVTTAPPDLQPLDASNVRVSDEDFFIPDLVVARAETVYDDGLMFRPADVVLAVEIVSQHTRKRDRILKLAAYAEAGIPHYWRVEPLEGPALYAYELDGDAYRLAKAAPGGKTTRLERPFPIEVDPADWVGPRRR